MIEDGPLELSELEQYDRLVVAYITQGHDGEGAHRKAKEEIITFRRATFREANENYFAIQSPPAQ